MAGKLLWLCLPDLSGSASTDFYWPWSSEAVTMLLNDTVLDGFTAG